MRLLYLSADPGVPVLGHKGASVHVRALASALAAAGADVAIASPRIQPAGDVLEGPVRLCAIPPVLPREAAGGEQLAAAVDAQAEAVARLAEELGAEAIYERFSLFSAAGVRAAAALGLPHVLEVNAPLREEAARYRTLPHPGHAAAIEQEVFAGSRRLLAVSPGLAEILVGDGAAAERVEVLPNAVAASAVPLRRRHPRHFVAGFAGSLKPWHGIETLVEALLQAPEVHLELVGDGPLAPLLGRLPAERVTLHGAVPHARALELMAGWDAGLAPYSPTARFWFSSLKVLEYMAAGACPVVSEQGDARAVLGAGARGELVPAGDAGALAAALRRLAADRARARRLGDRAREWVRAERTWGHNARRVLELLAPVAIGERA